MAGVRPENLRVSDIKSRLLNIAQTSLYRVTIPVPSGVSSFISRRGITSIDIDNISLLCSEASLPGSSLATHDVTNDYHGVTEKMAYRRMYDETLDLTFYVDRNYKVVDFFESWIDFISGVGSVFSRADFKSPYVHHRMAYPNDYKINMYLTKFEKDQHSQQSRIPAVTLDYTFVYAFPTNIIAVPVSYDQSQLLKCSVSFSYIRYVVERSSAASASSLVNFNAPGVPEVKSPQGTTVFNGPTPTFNTQRLSTTLTNEYYNNGIIRGPLPSQQIQGPGDIRQDATNFTRGIA
jgi:hypothetical protein